MSSSLASNDIPRREQDGDIVADGIVEASAIQEFVDVLQGVVAEARIHFNDDGLRAAAVDPANVQMVTATLGTDVFESYDAGAVTVGVNLNRLDEELGFANPGDLVRLRIDMETRKLRMDVSDHVKPTIGLIDPDAIRKEPDLPDLDLPNEAVVTPDQIGTAVKAVDNITDHIRVAWDGEAEAFLFHGQGDVDETRVEYELDALVGGHFDEEAASLFSLEYLKELNGAIPSSTEEVRIVFGDEFPMKWHYTGQEGALDVTALCAPRVESK